MCILQTTTEELIKQWQLQKQTEFKEIDKKNNQNSPGKYREQLR